MFGSEFSNKIAITKTKTRQSIELDERLVQIRQNQNGLMAVSYVAPVFEIMDVENFFDEVISSEKFTINIAETGETIVSYRGMVEGNNKNFPQNLDHKIILLQEPTCLDGRENVQLRGFSKFKPKGRISQ